MDIKPDAPIKEIQNMLRVQFAESITYKNCQLMLKFLVFSASLSKGRVRGCLYNSRPVRSY
jgi:hypothetical protein